MRNDRLIGIPVENEIFNKLKELSQLPQALLTELEQFFINYNKAAGKKFKVIGTIGSQAAAALIKKATRKKN
jgi:inorganic pyrophosphatase